MFSKLNTTSFISFAFRIPRALVLLWSQVAILFGGKRNQWGKSESTCLSSQLWCRGERKGNCNFQKFLGWLWTNRGIFKETNHYYSADSTAREGRIFFFSPEISRKKKQLPSSILFKKKKKKTSYHQSWVCCNGRKQYREAGLKVWYPEQVQNMGLGYLRVEKANVLLGVLVKA